MLSKSDSVYTREHPPYTLAIEILRNYTELLSHYRWTFLHERAQANLIAMEFLLSLSQLSLTRDLHGPRLRICRETESRSPSRFLDSSIVPRSIAT